MKQIDKLVKRLRATRVQIDFHRACADALESQSAEITRLRERNAELEKEDKRKADVIAFEKRRTRVQAERIASLEAELAIANKQIAETGRAWTADRQRLEATARELREALEQALGDMGDDGHGVCPACKELMLAALVSSESVVGKSGGKNDGE